MSNSVTIRCHKAFLEARCRERGKKLDEVLGCVVSQDGDIWEIDPSRPEYPRERGAGTELADLLKKFRIKPAGDCQCQEHAMTMDQMGTDWCRENIETISGWLRQEAQARGIPYFDWLGKKAILEAIRRAEMSRNRGLPT